MRIVALALFLAAFVLISGGSVCKSLWEFGRGGRIRTTDLLVPKQEISTTYENRSLKTQDLHVFGLDPIWTLKANVWRNGASWTLLGPWFPRR